MGQLKKEPRDIHFALCLLTLFASAIFSFLHDSPFTGGLFLFLAIVFVLADPRRVY